MTPRLRQAIELLQLNNTDLCAFIDQELERNPLLEVVKPTSPVASNTSASHTGANSENVKQYALAANNSASSERASFDNGPPQTGSTSVTLPEHLREQLNFEITDPTQRAIGLYLIATVGDDGYLSDDLGTIANELGYERVQIERTLYRLQHFDPPGVFARSLGECLKLQMREIGQLNPATEIIMDNLHLVAKHNFAALEKLCAISSGEIRDITAKIKTLNPKPGLNFHRVLPESIIPDAYTWRESGGNWMVELNDSMLPKLLVNSYYRKHSSLSDPSSTNRHYLTEQFQRANWLVRSLNQRAATLLAVAKELVRWQQTFLSDGIKFMKPLTLREIAGNLQIHESTVSRATVNKYIETPRGTFSFKYFFGPSIHSTTGSSTYSAKAVRYRIRSLIDRENPSAPSTDNHIAATLRNEGVDIARRTVTKYRGSMQILSSDRRRRLKTP